MTNNERKAICFLHGSDEAKKIQQLAELYDSRDELIKSREDALALKMAACSHEFTKPGLFCRICAKCGLGEDAVVGLQGFSHRGCPGTADSLHKWGPSLMAHGYHRCTLCGFDTRNAPALFAFEASKVT